MIERAVGSHGPGVEVGRSGSRDAGSTGARCKGITLIVDGDDAGIAEILVDG